MGIPAHFWMPASVTDQIAAVPGVAAASPQLYLATLRGATCCPCPRCSLIAYDPATDFTLRPWLEQNLKGELRLGEAVGGNHVYIPSGQDQILIYGTGVDLIGTLEQTGAGLDQSMFLTFETANRIARLSYTLAEKPLEIPPDSISSVLVKVAPGADVHQVAQIAAAIRCGAHGGLQPVQRAASPAPGPAQRRCPAGHHLAAGYGPHRPCLFDGRQRTPARDRSNARSGTRLTVLRSLLWEAVLLALVGGSRYRHRQPGHISVPGDLIIGLMGGAIPAAIASRAAGPGAGRAGPRPDQCRRGRPVPTLRISLRRSGGINERISQ